MIDGEGEKVLGEGVGLARTTTLPVPAAIPNAVSELATLLVKDEVAIEAAKEEGGAAEIDASSRRKLIVARRSTVAPARRRL